MRKCFFLFQCAFNITATDQVILFENEEKSRFDIITIVIIGPLHLNINVLTTFQRQN